MVSLSGLFGRVQLALSFSRDRVLAGQTVHVILRVTSTSGRVCRGAELALVGVEDIASARPARRIVLEERRTFDGFALDADRAHALSAQFAVPRDVPPTYTSRRARVHYEVRGSVKLAGLDRRVERPIEIGTRLVAQADTAEPPAAERGSALEVRLVSTDVESGGELRGSVASIEPMGAHPLVLEASIVTTETLVGREPAPLVVHIETQPLVVEERRAAPFAWELSGDLPPSFDGPRLRVASRLELAVVGRPAASIVSLPIVVHGAFALAREHVTQTRAAPIAAPWRSAIAAAAGPAVGIEVVDDAAASISIDGFGARLEARSRSSGQLSLLARVTFADLGLRFELEERFADRAQRPAGGRFEGRFRIWSRERQQLDALLDDRDLRAAFFSCPSVSADDTCAMHDDEGISGTPVDIEQFVRRSIALQRAVSVAARSIVPPRVFVAVASAWAAFAERRHAALRRGDMAVTGLAIGPRRFDVTHVFEGEVPSETRIALAAAGAYDAATLDALSDEVDARVESRLGGLFVRLPPAEDPGDVEPTLMKLGEALARLVPGERSPYR